jgi:hypothetical protein
LVSPALAELEYWMNKIICLVLVAAFAVTSILSVSVSAAQPLRDRTIQIEALVDKAK